MNRLKEPSTWAGLAVLAAQAGKLVMPSWAMIFDALAMLAGGAAVAIKEKGAQ